MNKQLLRYRSVRYFAIFILGLSLLACNREVPSEFSELALNDIFVNENGDKVKFGSILDSYKGQTIIIDVWASWCGDCIKNLPEVRTLQEQYSDVVFLFLSVDKNQRNWKEGIEKYNIKGEHYYMQSGWNGDFGDFIDLDWTPRYIVVDKDQKIKLFKAVKANDKRIKKILL